eukprot:1157750-Pelagomonas_calceolata.AAC.4
MASLFLQSHAYVYVCEIRRVCVRLWKCCSSPKGSYLNRDGPDHESKPNKPLGKPGAQPPLPWHHSRNCKMRDWVAPDSLHTCRHVHIGMLAAA